MKYGAVRKLCLSTFRDTDSLLESTLIVALTVDDSNLGPSIADTLVWTFSLAFSYFIKASDL